MEDEDRHDIEASIAGDGDAYARLVRRHEKPVAAQMWRFCRDRTVCEELVQDVFVETWKSLPAFRGDAPLLHWIRRIATRVGYRYWKRRDRDSRKQPIQSFDALTEDEDHLGPAEAADVLGKLLDRLKPADRLVLTLMYFDECGTEEIAEQTGWNRAMVKMRAYRARRTLRKLIESENVLEKLGWNP